MSDNRERHGRGRRGSSGRGGGGGRGRGGYRREEDGHQMDQISIKRPPKPPISEEILCRFRNFQSELDFRHDKHERLVKCSRDITIESKRIIFLLHRVIAAWSSPNDAESILKEAENRLESVRTDQWSKVAQELDGEDPHCFSRAYSPGLQEYIEAATFAYYLRNKTLLSWTDLRFRLSGFQSENGQDSCAVQISLIDYLCGVADLTGELMRAAINAIAAGDQCRPVEICEFLNGLFGGCSLFGNTLSMWSRDWTMKMRVFRQSLAKVENVCYILKLRGTEIPDYMLAEVVTSGGTQYSAMAEETPGDGQTEAW